MNHITFHDAIASKILLEKVMNYASSVINWYTIKFLFECQTEVHNKRQSMNNICYD